MRVQHSRPRPIGRRHLTCPGGRNRGYPRPPQHRLPDRKRDLGRIRHLRRRELGLKILNHNLLALFQVTAELLDKIRRRSERASEQNQADYRRTRPVAPATIQEDSNYTQATLRFQCFLWR